MQINSKIVKECSSKEYIDAVNAIKEEIERLDKQELDEQRELARFPYAYFLKKL